MDLIRVVFVRKWSVTTYRQRTRGAVPVLGDSETNTFFEVVNDNFGPGWRVRLVDRKEHIDKMTHLSDSWPSSSS